jgi:hypothetical protein
MRCIFCLEANPESGFTDEHVFPEAIGGKFVIRSVCGDCNGKLGRKVDCLLTEHVLIQMRRKELGLAGKTGRVPDPLADMTLSGTNYPIRNSLDADGKPRHYMCQHVERTLRPDGTERVSIAVDASDRSKLPEILTKILSRRGKPPLSKEQIDAMAPVICTPHPWMEKTFIVDEHEYKRAILKVAYELGCYWLGSSYLDDPLGKTIREWILSDGPSDDESAAPIPGTVDLYEAGGTGLFWEQEENSHIGILIPMPENFGGIAVYVRVFKEFEAKVLLSKCNARTAYPNLEAMFLCNPVDGSSVRASTFSREWSRLRKAHGP